METLNYGYKKPQSDDIGKEIFDALEGNISQVAVHNHDGENSAPIPSTSIQKVNQDIVFGTAAGEYVLDADTDRYSRTITIPGGKNFDDVLMSFRDSDTKEQVYPTVKKASATTYTLTINKSGLNLTAYYI